MTTVSGMISKTDVLNVVVSLEAIKYVLLNATMEVEKLSKEVDRIRKAFDEPSDSSPDGSLFPT